MRDIGEKIGAARTAKGWSQQELAKRAGVSQGTIGHLESGRNASSTKLSTIARALGLTVEELTAGVVPVLKEPEQWPFGIEIERVLALPADRRAKIEGYIEAIVGVWEDEKVKRKTG